MKKSLLAVAVAAALPVAAQAQSNVTMYGILDAAVEYWNDDAAGNVNPAAPIAGDAHFRMTNGLQSGSRLGFRGVEDIGGGLKGIFTIEHRLNVDDGRQSAARFWHGQAWVGLEAGWGRLTLGRQYTPLFWALLPADFTGYAFYNNWAGFSGNASPGNLSIQGPIRIDNSLSYRSPTMGGFTVYAAYAFGESPNTTIATGNLSPGDTPGNDLYGIAATWQMGNFFLGGGYHAVQDVPVTTPAGAFEDVAAITASWKTAGWGVSVGYSQIGFSGTGEAENIFGSAFLNLAGGTLVANVIQIEPDGFAGIEGGTALQWGLAYHRPLSKRTNWYVAYGANDLAAVNAPGTINTDPQRIALGVRHLF
jgi:predicted porin